MVPYVILKEKIMIWHFTSLSSFNTIYNSYIDDERMIKQF